MELLRAGTLHVTCWCIEKLLGASQVYGKKHFSLACMWSSHSTSDTVRETDQIKNLVLLYLLVDQHAAGNFMSGDFLFVKLPCRHFSHLSFLLGLQYRWTVPVVWLRSLKICLVCILDCAVLSSAKISYVITSFNWGVILFSMYSDFLAMPWLRDTAYGSDCAGTQEADVQNIISKCERESLEGIISLTVIWKDRKTCWLIY